VSSVFHVHKPGKGKLTRMVTLLGGLFLLVWGCRSLLYELPSFWRPLGNSWNELVSDAKPEAAWKVDLVLFETNFSPALTASVLVLLVGGLLWFRLVNRAKIADPLVDMEDELKKVSWPSFSDAWQSTLVVSGFTALIVVLVFTYDIVIKGIIDLMPVGRI
jgi:preprotein translocase SecE subunit